VPFLKAQTAPKGFAQPVRKQVNRDKNGQGFLPGDITFAGATVETKVTPDKTRAEEARDTARQEAMKKADAARQTSLWDDDSTV
jgi:hypothetical protein